MLTASGPLITPHSGTVLTTVWEVLFNSYPDVLHIGRLGNGLRMKPLSVSPTERITTLESFYYSTDSVYKGLSEGSYCAIHLTS